MRRVMNKYVCGAVSLAVILLLLAAGMMHAKTGTYKDTDLPCVEIHLSDVSLEELHSGNKTTKYSGNQVTVTDPKQGMVCTDPDVELKGRGNSSWKMPKRSYQIRFHEKRSLLGMHEAKKWLLIANYADASLMRNRLICDLAGEMMDYAPDSRYVDLWIDGEYLGNYLLCEKIEVDDEKVKLQNDMGLLAEVDNFYYYETEEQFQSSVSGSHFIMKDAKNHAASAGAFEAFEAFINRFESLLYAEETDWEQLSLMIDVESFIQYYFMQELAENSDSCRTSLYMYWDGPDDQLHMGPVWDFDKAVGYSMRAKFGGDTEADYVKNIQDYMGTEKDIAWYTELFKIPEFCEEVSRVYEEQIREVLYMADALMDQYREEIAGSANRNFRRWEITEIPENCGHDPYTYETWEEAADGLTEWVRARIIYLDQTYSVNDSAMQQKKLTAGLFTEFSYYTS